MLNELNRIQSGESMTELTPSQTAALNRLSKSPCFYEEIVSVNINGRTLTGLVSRGLAIRGELQPEGQPWEITDAGRMALQEQ